MRWIALAGLAAGAALVVLAVGRSRSDRNIRTLWSELAAQGDGEPFQPGMVADLPDPARRLLLRAIAPGTPLARSAELEMRGEIRLAPERDPLTLRAGQVLAPPDGFIWRAQAWRGLLRIGGFDRYGRGEGEVRWLLWGLVPVVRAVGPEVTRSAAGRLAMEAVLFPPALLPGRGAVWEPVDAGQARFRLTVGDETVTTTVVVDPEGRPLRASAMRWSEDAGPGYDLFAVELGGELRSGGYTIPSELAAGWRLGQEDEFRFFRATLERAVFR